MIYQFLDPLLGFLMNFFVFFLGFGRIGQAVAQRCLGFDSNVYVYDPGPSATFTMAILTQVNFA